MKFGKKIKLKKLLKSPIAMVVLLVFAWPFLWLAATGVTLASYSTGLTSHLGAARGYFSSHKLFHFFSFTGERIHLSYGYGSRYFWASEGTEIYLNYSATNYGEEALVFIISDYNAGLKLSDVFETARVPDSGSGTLTYTVKESGFYDITIQPMRLVPAGDVVSYTYSMSWGTRE